MMAWMRWRKGWKRAAMTSVETTIATALFWWNIPWNSDCKAKMRPKYSRASRAVKLPYTSVRLISTSISYSRYRKIENPMESGIRRQDAHNYQSELDAGRSIVLIKAVGSPEQALSILRQSGAYDIAFRFRTAPPTMPSGTYNSNAQPGTYDATQPQPGQPITRGE